MTGTRIAATVLSLAPVALVAQGPLRVADLKVSEPTLVATLDMGDVKGQPFRLAWSPDHSQLYVQTLEGTYADANAGRPNARLHHYLYASTPGASSKSLKTPPDWFAAYWNSKNGQFPPDAPSLRIEVKNEQRKTTATSTPMGGDLAKGGVVSGDAGTSAGDAAAAAYGAQMVAVNVLHYKGERIGEFVNSVIVPGLTYGWGPKGTNVLAFAAPAGSGRITIVDEQGGKLALETTKDGLLPAWSHDAKRLAWLQKDGRKKFQLYVATVSRP